MTGTNRKLGGRHEGVLKQMKSLGIRQSRSVGMGLVDYSMSALTAGSDFGEDQDWENTTEVASTLAPAREELDEVDSSSYSDSDSSEPSSSGSSGLLSPQLSLQGTLLSGLGQEDAEFLQQHGLDKCTPVRELGKGGYGAVDLVQVTLPGGRTVSAARKVIHSPLYGQSRYERELRGLMLCSECPFVVDIYAAKSSPEEGDFAFLLEYCPNGSLHDMLKAMEQRRRGKEKLLMAKQRVQCYAACILKGLQFIHSRGQAHRDVKPHNVLMAANGRPVLADTDAMEACDITKRAGTTAYQAPELWRASLQPPGYNTKAADMYSFGVTLVEMAAFPSISGANSKLQAVKDDPRSSLPNYVPDDLQDLICGLLAGPKERLDVEQAMQHSFFDGFDWDSAVSGPLGFAVQLRA